MWRARTDIARVEPCSVGSDVRELSAELLPLLPLRASLYCQSRFASLPCTLTTSRAVWQAHRRLRRVVFGVLEWQALVSSVSNDRASPADFVDWCAAKAERPTFKVTTRDTLGQLPREHVLPASSAISVGRVLDAFALVLTAVWYGDDGKAGAPC